MWLPMGDPHMPGSAGERFDAELEARALADVVAGRCRSSESALYGEAYSDAATERSIAAREILVCVAEAVGCSGCGVIDVAPRHYTCHCPPGAVAPKIVGMFSLFGVDSEDRQASFLASGAIATLVATGVRVQDVYGRDITTIVHRTQ